jgi:DNA polymerase III delta prime subunit
MRHNERETIWCEKFRPDCVDDIVLPTRIKSQFEDIVKGDEIPNMLFYGGAGVGKTTLAKALCKEVDVDWLIINMSEETGVDVLRTKIRDFASTLSLSGKEKKKCVILDEFENSSQSFQAAFRGFVEAFSKTCSFVLTCNFPNRVIDPIKSRMLCVDFGVTKEESMKMQAQMFKRVSAILDFEQIPFDKRVVVKLVQKFYPDNRRILNQIQQYSKAGEIDEGILLNIEEMSIEKLVLAMKGKNFKDVRQWCVENAKNDLTNTYTMLYAELKNFVEPSSVPQAVITIGDYQRYDSVVPDKEIHICALATQIMMEVDFL